MNVTTYSSFYFGMLVVSCAGFVAPQGEKVRDQQNSSAILSEPPNLEECIGQKIIVGFVGTQETDAGVQEILELAQKGFIGGIILFKRNIVTKDQVRTLIKKIQAAARYPLLVSVDQEGGKVQRLKEEQGFTNYLSAYQVACTMTPGQAYNYYLNMARELKEVGINCTYGPVVDFHEDPVTKKKSPAIGLLERAYSAEVESIVSYAEAFIKAHTEQGILTCLKHYPGHGLASSDSHDGPVDITATHQSQEREPYRKMLAQGFTGMVMVAHLTHQGLDATVPTSLSKKLIHQWLRKEDGFEGVVITDDLLMGAIQKEFGFSEVVLRSLQAGVDIVLFRYCNASDLNLIERLSAPIRIIEIAKKALEEKKLDSADLFKSWSRIMSMKMSIQKPHGAIVMPQ